MNRLDHVTLGTASLEAGAVAVRATLGIDLAPGGRHPDMSTHNRVLNVGDERFLELIAVDPDAPPVRHRRWFGLDEPAVAARIATAPRGLGWVVRTDALDDVVAASPVDLGRARRMSRGERTWRLTVPDGGMTAFDGLVPAFIEWSPGPHPSSGMPFGGAILEGLELRHPQAARLREVLQALGVLSLVSAVEPAEAPSLSFRFRCGDGSVRTIGA